MVFNPHPHTTLHASGRRDVTCYVSTTFAFRDSLRLLLAAFFILFTLASCSPPPPAPTSTPEHLTTSAPPSSSTSTPQPSLTPTPTPEPRTLTICLGQEPQSLFPYAPAAASASAQAILAAVYDGPTDRAILDQQVVDLPILLESIPSFENGAALLQPATVNPGDWLVDSRGQLVQLAEGVSYWPAGCRADCLEQLYSGSQPVQVDALVLRFTLRPALSWSDGQPLTAGDSRYAYEVAQALDPMLPGALPEVLRRTISYTALDERTLEWVGLPGDLDRNFAARFFLPLPRHAWGSLSAAQLLEPETAQHPLGWGPYVLDEWLPAQQITLRKNPAYFRAAEGLPYFDRLVYRFIPDASAAWQAFSAGECDLLDHPALSTGELSQPLADLLAQNQRIALRQPASWMHLLFNITPFAADVLSQPPHPLASADLRSALAACIDRSALVQAVGAARGAQPPELAAAYIPAQHPYFNPAAAFPAQIPDPAALAARFDAAGWVDADANPATPRQSRAVPGIFDATPLSLRLWVNTDAASQAAALTIQQSLAQCGVQVNIETRPAAEYLAPGPQGPVFGRAFDLALLSWPAASLPPCSLYQSSEVPGPYPTFPKGWGGANASGYQNPEFDRLCRAAHSALTPVETLPSLYADLQSRLLADPPFAPLYWREKLIAHRADLCGPQPSLLGASPFASIETWRTCP